MIEDLLQRIQSNVGIDTAERAIEHLPVEYRIVIDLYYGWELTHREVAAVLGWSTGKVRQRLTRGASLLKLRLHPEAFQKAYAILQKPL